MKMQWYIHYKILYPLIFIIAFFCGVMGYNHIIFPKKIAVLYIMTNRYTIFWEDFYKSAETYFLPKHKKHYFVFTDDEDFQLPDNATKIKAKYKNFPEVTLKRYEMFLQIEEQLRTYDYIFFFNANSLFLNTVQEEILPDEKQGITVVIHPAFWGNTQKATFERDTRSTAFIPYGQEKYYVRGSFNGGIAKDFLDLCRECDKNTRVDEQNNITAIWHDESHLNKYILDKTPLVLTPEYNYSKDCGNRSSLNIPLEDIKIILRDKEDPLYGGKNYLRNFTNKKNK